MASTFTPNIQLEEPARGDDVGTWDTPVNSNMTLIDKVVGANTIIALNNSPMVLSAAQFQSKLITFNSTLTGNVTITFPTSFSKSYEIQNNTTGSSAFIITLATTAGGFQIACPPGETFDCFNDGLGSIRFKNLGRIGSYWDYAGSAVPAWVANCSIAPYLNCDGSAFSSAAYPALTTILNGTTLPDRRGTAGYALNQGTGRITAASGGLDGNTIFATKLSQTVTITTPNLPAYTPAGTMTAGTFLKSAGVVITVAASAGSVVDGVQPGTGSLSALSFAGTAQGGISTPMPAIGTGTVYGICMIRAG